MDLDPGTTKTVYLGLKYGELEDPDPLYPNVNPRIRIRIRIDIKWIRNAAFFPVQNMAIFKWQGGG